MMTEAEKAESSKAEYQVEAPTSATASRPQAGRQPSAMRRTLGLLAGIVVFAGMIIVGGPESMPEKAWMVAATGCLMAIWWILEAIPIPATALAPIALLPLTGVTHIKGATEPFANPLIYLFLGGFIIAVAMEKWNLHRRIALFILKMVGSHPAALIAGFMAATAFLSMWVSNTATATMMLPIGLSVAALINEESNGNGGTEDPFTPALLLGIAYAASIGGIGTLIGTPPNALLAGFFSQNYHVTIGFADWMVMAVPLELVMLVIAWLVLTRVAFPVRKIDLSGAENLISREIDDLGPVSRGEMIVAAIFVLTATCWMLRPMIDGALPGVKVTDTGIAVIAAIIIFVIPVYPSKRVFLLDWTDTKGLPWGVLILFGGGLSLGAAINGSGLSTWIAESMGAASDLPVLTLIIAIAGVVTLISHMTSNTATAAAFLPLAAALALSLGQNPLVLAVPAVLAASCVFMMPVATPPNAIVFASGALTVPQMVRAGILINIAALVLIVFVAYTALEYAFGVQFGVVPDWAIVK